MNRIARLLLVLALVGLFQSSGMAAERRNTIFLNHGRTLITVPATWETIAHNPRTERQYIAYRAVNDPDRGRPSSATFIALTVRCENDRSYNAYRERITCHYQGVWVKKGAWTTVSGEGTYKDVEYRIRDRFSRIGRTVYHLRMAWPVKDEEQTGYGEALEREFERIASTMSTLSN